MEKFENFLSLLESYKSIPHGMIYSVEHKENDLKNATFYVVDSVEEKSMEFMEGDLGEVPVEIYDDKDIVSELIETQTFKTIIDKQFEKNANLDIDKNIKVFIAALEFYLEYDTFKDS